MKTKFALALLFVIGVFALLEMVVPSTSVSLPAPDIEIPLEGLKFLFSWL